MEAQYLSMNGNIKQEPPDLSKSTKQQHFDRLLPSVEAELTRSSSAQVWSVMLSPINLVTLFTDSALFVATLPAHHFSSGDIVLLYQQKSKC